MKEDLLVESASFMPLSLHPPNSWCGHMNFAFWLMRIFTPKIFVELGTQSGNSYFSFCQSVKDAGIATACYAVDTWQGDEHAGFYDEKVYLDVNKYNEEHYADFSSLLRMKFGDALSCFTDSSIDLLHIDGFHTYEAVKHDFETWLPKLTPGAIVLLHDTKVRERGFGVWRLWKELQMNYPNNIEFIHSYGLGVLQLDGATGRKKMTWLDPNYTQKEQIKNYFSSLGVKQFEHFELRQMKIQVANLGLSIGERDGQIINFNTVQKLIEQVEKKTADIAERDRQIDDLHQALTEQEKQIAYVNKVIKELEAHIECLEKDNFLRGEWALSLERELKDAQSYIENIMASNSFRVTEPFRNIRRSLTRTNDHIQQYKRNFIEKYQKINIPLILEQKAKTDQKSIMKEYKTNLSQQSHLLKADSLNTFVENNSTENKKSTGSASFKEEVLLKKKEQFDKFIKSGAMLAFPRKKPILSIILVLFNNAPLSFSCVQSILKNVYVDYEMIIVDNNSTDETPLLLDRVSGAAVIKNEENLHFIKANNQALEYVQGEYILFLNNDTEIAESAILSAMNTLKNNEKCGAVGGKLILPDGTLQEAGSIIWSDGSCLGYGRGQNHKLPEFNFKRVTDYCSGAFLLTKAALFREHRGFDKRFEPAYYEETDYCLWLQQKGLQVVYDPGAVVHHFEFGSGASDEAMILQQKNQRVFCIKHDEQLKKHYKYDLSAILSARFGALRKGRKKVLYIEDRIPHVDLGAGFPRANTIVRFIKELDYDLTIYPLNFPNEDSWNDAYRDIDPYIEIARGYGLSQLGQFINERKNYYDIIWISRPHNMERAAEHIAPLKGRCKIVYDAEAIFAERDILQKELNGQIISSTEKNILYENELKLSDMADTIITVSENDALKFINFGQNDVFVLSHVLESNKMAPGFDSREGLLFVGNMDYDDSPNVDSVIWFVEEIFPIIKKEIPSITLDLVGTANSSRIRLINKEGVFIHGKVKYLSLFYNKCRIFIAPTRYAAGIPFKIHEAASFGLPVVATDLLRCQLGWNHKKELLAAETDKLDFAQKIIKLYYDKELWNKIQKNAMNFIRNEMSPDAYKRKITEILKYRN